MRWLRRILGGDERPARAETKAEPDFEPLPEVDDLPLETIASNRTRAEAFLKRVQSKIDRLVEDFAAGTVNQSQFQRLYTHYHDQMQSIQTALQYDPQSWQQYATEGKSIVIRKQHSPKARAYAIYENLSGMPISTLGTFAIDPALLVPMLSSYRSAAHEIFGAGIQTTEIEGDKWLCFVPGDYTTMLALFTNQPAGKQLEFLGQLHAEFEKANQRHLAAQPIDKRNLVFPHEYFLGKWNA